MMQTGSAEYGMIPSNVRDLRPVEVVPNRVTMEDVMAELNFLRHEISQLRSDFGESKVVIEKVAGEVMPAINELVNGPIGMMLGMKKSPGKVK